MFTVSILENVCVCWGGGGGEGERGGGAQKGKRGRCVYRLHFGNCVCVWGGGGGARGGGHISENGGGVFAVSILENVWVAEGGGEGGVAQK